jgi:hypothetical protein
LRLSAWSGKVATPTLIRSGGGKSPSSTAAEPLGDREGVVAAEARHELRPLSPA